MTQHAVEWKEARSIMKIRRDSGLTLEFILGVPNRVLIKVNRMMNYE